MIILQHMLSHLVADLISLMHCLLLIPYHLMLLIGWLGSTRLVKTIIKMILIGWLITVVFGHIGIYLIAGNPHYGALGVFAEILLKGYCPLVQTLFNTISIVLAPLAGIRPQAIELCCNGSTSCVKSLPVGVIMGWVIYALLLLYIILRYFKSSSSNQATGTTIDTVLNEVSDICHTLPLEAQTHCVGQAQSLLSVVKREQTRM